MEEFLVIAACLLLNALFAAFEMAFVSVPRPELRRLARLGNPEARILVSLRDRPERTLAVLQIGISLVGILAAAVGGAGATQTLQPYLMKQWKIGKGLAELLSLGFVALPLTYLSVVAGELVPKSLALRDPVKIALAGARWLRQADRILTPAVLALERSTQWVLRVFFRRTRPPEKLPETTVEIDSLAPTHQQAILNLARIEGRRIADIVVPWPEVTFVKASDPLEEVVPVVFASGHTRLPVADNGDVAGILHTKEFLGFRETGGKDWRETIKPGLRVRSTDSLLGILRLMQSERSHMAIVFTPTGKRLGIVTMEDITEEIFGDIFDEDEDSRIRKIFAERVKSRALRRSG
ncbi:MAG: hemolysin family protein [Oligoflexia bacterium]|nr:hemolysin family protein [Oligoflexia bacterium]